MFKKALAGIVMVAATTYSHAAVMVDLELQLLADVSGSISSEEYKLQLQGYEKSFRSSDVHAAITQGEIGSIAVQYIEWSSADKQEIQVDWFEINSASSANAFADLLAGVTRSFFGGTEIDDAINFGSLQFDNDFIGTRQVMDISGDGTSDEVETSTARDNALLSGIDTINGISIGKQLELSSFYDANVIGGQGAFQINASSFSDFTTGIERKLIREISSEVPEPSSLALLTLGLLGGHAARKRRR